MSWASTSYRFKWNLRRHQKGTGETLCGWLQVEKGATKAPREVVICYGEKKRDCFFPTLNGSAIVSFLGLLFTEMRFCIENTNE